MGKVCLTKVLMSRLVFSLAECYSYNIGITNPILRNYWRITRIKARTDESFTRCPSCMYREKPEVHIQRTDCLLCVQRRLAVYTKLCVHVVHVFLV